MFLLRSSAIGRMLEKQSTTNPVGKGAKLAIILFLKSLWFFTGIFACHFLVYNKNELNLLNEWRMGMQMYEEIRKKVKNHIGLFLIVFSLTVSVYRNGYSGDFAADTFSV